MFESVVNYVIELFYLKWSSWCVVRCRVDVSGPLYWDAADHKHTVTLPAPGNPIPLRAPAGVQFASLIGNA